MPGGRFARLAVRCHWVLPALQEVLPRELSPLEALRQARPWAPSAAQLAASERHPCDRLRLAAGQRERATVRVRFAVVAKACRANRRLAAAWAPKESQREAFPTQAAVRRELLRGLVSAPRAASPRRVESAPNPIRVVAVPCAALAVRQVAVQRRAEPLAAWLRVAAAEQAVLLQAASAQPEA